MTESEKQLEFLAKQAQELNMGYEMTEAQNKAEEICIQTGLPCGFPCYSNCPKNLKMTEAQNKAEEIREMFNWPSGVVSLSIDSLNKLGRIHVKGMIEELREAVRADNMTPYLRHRLSLMSEVLKHLEG